MSEFGVVCGMTMPMLALPTVFLGALNLVLVPKLARSAALGRQEEIRRRASRAMSALSVLILPAMALMTVIGSDLGELMFRQDGVGEYLVPLAVVMVLSCYESTLGAVLSGVGRQGLVALISILCGGVQLAFTVAAVPLPGVGMGGYVAGALVSTLLGLALCAWMAARHTGLKLQLFQWLTAPGLAALLMALCSNLLFRALKDSGVSLPWACLGCAGFGGVLYLAALSAQGVRLRELFRLR